MNERLAVLADSLHLKLPPPGMRDVGPFDTASDEDDRCDAYSEEDDDDEEEEFNIRMSPRWDGYKRILEKRGFLLDTCRDVKEYYEQHCEGPGRESLHNIPGYQRACLGKENALCRDAGLVSNRRLLSSRPVPTVTFSSARGSIPRTCCARWCEDNGQGRSSP
jgi:hypothetical protein